jgi:LPS O-antigen subunit length determinant protein (WzzB/FepE family)
MSPSVMTPTPEYTAQVAATAPADWLSRGVLLWQYRRTLARVTAIAMVTSLCIAFVIPKQYKSVASIMPPDQQGSGAMLLAALAGARQPWQFGGWPARHPYQYGALREPA